MDSSFGFIGARTSNGVRHQGMGKWPGGKVASLESGRRERLLILTHDEDRSPPRRTPAPMPSVPLRQAQTAASHPPDPSTTGRYSDASPAHGTDQPDMPARCPFRAVPRNPLSPFHALAPETCPQ